MTTSEILMLAVDQRPWLTKALYGHGGEATPGERSAIAAGKHAVLEGLLEARRRSGSRTTGRAALLVDEKLGPGVAERARAEGVILSMPVERGGMEEYEDEPDDLPAWLNHHKPDLTKVLVRYNPDQPPDSKERQLTRLAATAAAAKDAGTQFLFELLVPPMPHQIEATGGDLDAFAEGQRPKLIQQAMGEIASRVHVDLWKLEHLGSEEDYRAAVELAAGHEAGCILLGAGAPSATVNEWLRRASRSGFSGFAIGRTIWWEAFQDLLHGRIEKDRAADLIAQNYLGFVDVFQRDRQKVGG